MYECAINSTGNAIEIARGKVECYFNCFTSAIDPLIAQVTRAITR